MATHPSERGCTCEWSGDDHYPQFIKWDENCTYHSRGKPVIWKPMYSLEVKPYMREKTITEEDPFFKTISRGDGFSFIVPNWVAEILQRHPEEVEITEKVQRILGEQRLS